MEEALQKFTAWFIKFVIVSGTLLLVTHLIARSLRKKKARLNQSQTEEVSKPD